MGKKKPILCIIHQQRVHGSPMPALLRTARRGMPKRTLFRNGHLQKGPGTLGAASSALYQRRFCAARIRPRGSSTGYIVTMRAGIFRVRLDAEGDAPSRHGLANGDWCSLVPIRMKEDLLPVENITTSPLTGTLVRATANAGCRASRQLAGNLIEDQLPAYWKHCHCIPRRRPVMAGISISTWCVSSKETGFRCLFLTDSVIKNSTSNKRTKLPNRPSPWWNLLQVANQGAGKPDGINHGSLKTSCLAKGRADLGKLLVDELQNALDQLKFGTQPNQDVIKSIRSEVTKAPWLGYKQKRRIDEMPEHLNIEATDNVGQLSNFLRKELGRFLGEASVAPLSDFRGIIGGESFTQEIYQECYRVNRWYASQVQQSLSRRQQLSKELDAAQAAVEAVKNDSEARKKALFRRNQASGAYFEYEKRSADELKALIRQVRLWGQSKNGTRLSYLSALHSIVCRDKRPNQEQNNPTGTGSIVFYAFPQEVVNHIAERTGGRPINVEIPELCDGEVQIDTEGRIFLINQVQQDDQCYETLTFLAQVTKTGEVFLDRDSRGNPVISHRVRPFPIQAGRSEIKDGKVVFPGIQQRPQVPQKTDRDTEVEPEQ